MDLIALAEQLEEIDMIDQHHDTHTTGRGLQRFRRWFGLGTVGLLAAAAMVVLGTGNGLIPSGESRVTAQPATSGFVSLNPTRIFNTRDGNSPVAGEEMTVRTGISGASAAAISLTMTNTERWGYLTAWASGARPDTSVINVDGPGQTVANYMVVPVTQDGDFQLWTFAGTDVIVDLMGYFTSAGSSPAPAPAPAPGHGVTAVITGYSPGFSITSISGTATNTSGTERSVRVDVTCPNGTTETRSVFGIPSGDTRGWSVICDGVFSSGASIARVVEI